MSERKRNLFDKKYSSLALIIDDDVDLGPMSPLQYSSSPNDDMAHGVPFDRNAKQTDFSNLFPGSLKPTACLSPINSLNSPLFSTEKQMLVLEETASTVISVQSGSGMAMPHLLAGSNTELSSIPEEVVNKSRTVQEKTPSERMINCQDLRVSFKKSLILGDMMTPTDDDQRHKNHQKRSYSMSVLTEKNANCDSTSPKEKQQKLDDPSRARTSLTFEGQSAVIPTNRFYSHNEAENQEPTRKRYSLPLPSNTHKGRKITPINHRRSSNGVSRKGCSHNIKKPVRAPPKESLKKKVELVVLDMDKEEKDKDKMTVEEAQSNRIHEIFKNIKNPLEMSRPLFFTEKSSEDRFHIADEEVDVDPEEGEKSKKRFFKSGTTGAKSYKLTNNVVATVEGGKITLPKFPVNPNAVSAPLNKSANDPADFSMVDEEFGSEFQEVTDIISKLTSDNEMDTFRSRIPYQTTDPELIRKQKDLLEMLITNQLCNEENFKIFIAEPDQHKEAMNKIMDSLVDSSNDETTTKTTSGKPGLFPIFYNSNRAQTKRKLVSLGEEKTSPSRKIWKRIGDSQLQIDAGQKRFGATYCAECDLLYSVHEPEDELMHDRFHRALAVLSFPGWKTENVFREMPQWGVRGRILSVAWNAHKAKVHRVDCVLNVINNEMGCPPVEWKSKTIVYLAVAQNTILGVCVAESKYEANRLVTENGVDYFSEENYPVWCGISRIWVAAPYRNQGVATELVSAVRAHFTIGRTLGVEEIAFQSPTEAGKLLGQKVTSRKDFLVYP